MALGLCAFSGSGLADVLVQVIPSAQVVGLGSGVVANVQVSGLVDGAAPSLSAYDISVVYDPAILSFFNLTFGDPIFGNQLDLAGSGTLQFPDTGTPGVLTVAEISFDDAQTLDTQQLDTFILFQFSFNTLSAGTSGLGLQLNALGDSLGDPLQASSLDGQITVQDEGAIPEPRTWVQLGLGIAAFTILSAARTRKR